MAWEQLPWDQRLFALDVLSEDVRGKLIALILNLPRDDRETAVPKNKVMAVASLNQLLAQAEAGMCCVA